MIYVHPMMIKRMGAVKATGVSVYSVKIGELRDNWNTLYGIVVGRGLSGTAFPENIKTDVMNGRDQFRAWLSEHETFSGWVSEMWGSYEKEVDDLITIYNHILAIVVQYSANQQLAVATFPPRILPAADEETRVATPVMPSPTPRPRPRSPGGGGWVILGLCGLLLYVVAQQDKGRRGE